MKAQDTPHQEWAIREHSRTVHELNFDLPRVGGEFRVLLQSDVHWDNPKCDRDLFHRHLKAALAINAPVLDNGDFFCAMQGKYDPRASKKDLRPEHMDGPYLDRLIETAAEDLDPYREILAFRGMGNHETNILKRQETNLNERLTERLRAAGSPAMLGGYSGWLRLSATYAGTRTRSFILWHHHGSGGGGPVTRGVIQTNRTAVYLPNADVVWQGHTHDSWIVPIERVRLTASNRQELVRQYHVRTPGYKEEYSTGEGGFHIERGAPPKPVGAAWLVVKWERHDEPPKVRIEMAE